MHTLVNIDIFRKKSTVKLPAIKAYRVFVLSIALYFIADLLWGILEECKLATALYVETCFYFVIMGFTILAWTRYIVEFIGGKKWFTRATLITGNVFFLAEIVLIIVNIFVPILFTVDPVTCVYNTYRARRIMLYVQILMYFLLVIYSTIKAFKANNSSSRRKFMIISLYSIIMGSAITVQIYFPYLPLYSIGCIIGAVLLNSFVINDIKEEYKSALEESREQVQQGQLIIDETRHIAYTDPLTNVHNKHAYVEEEERIDKLINKGEMEDFAVVVFDLNGLKIINDTKGHDAGDVYIVDACNTIKRFFGEEHLYRFGGDEFVVVLMEEGFTNRNKLMEEFESYIDNCVGTEKPIISSGMSRFKRKEDNTYHAVFYRADKIMYSRKDILKEKQSNL